MKIPPALVPKVSVMFRKAILEYLWIQERKKEVFERYRSEKIDITFAYFIEPQVSNGIIFGSPEKLYDLGLDSDTIRTIFVYSQIFPFVSEKGFRDKWKEVFGKPFRYDSPFYLVDIDDLGYLYPMNPPLIPEKISKPDIRQMNEVRIIESDDEDEENDVIEAPRFVPRERKKTGRIFCDYIPSRVEQFFEKEDGSYNLLNIDGFVEEMNAHLSLRTEIIRSLQSDDNVDFAELLIQNIPSVKRKDMLINWPAYKSPMIEKILTDYGVRREDIYEEYFNANDRRILLYQEWIVENYGAETIAEIESDLSLPERDYDEILSILRETVRESDVKIQKGKNVYSVLQGEYQKMVALKKIGILMAEIQ